MSELTPPSTPSNSTPALKFSCSNPCITFPSSIPFALVDTQKLIEDHNLGKEEDERDADLLLEQFEQLSKDFQCWSVSRLNRDDVAYYTILEEEEQRAIVEQDKQEKQRQFIDSIVQQVKDIFRDLQAQV